MMDALFVASASLCMITLLLMFAYQYGRMLSLERRVAGLERRNADADRAYDAARNGRKVTRPLTIDGRLDVQ